MAPAPGKRERPEVHLALAAGRRLEADRRLDRLARPRRTHVVAHPGVAARIARRADLVEQPLRRQLRERLETRLDDRLVGIQLVRHRRPRRVPAGTGRELPVQLAGLDPVVDRAPAHPEAPRQLGLRDAPVQIMLQQHPRLPSVHPSTASRSVGSASRANRQAGIDKPKVRNFGSAQMRDYDRYQHGASPVRRTGNGALIFSVVGGHAARKGRPVPCNAQSSMF